MKRISFMFLAATILMVGLAFSAEITPLIKQKCCISGVYEGWNADIASPTCPEPGKGTFTMYLYQDKDCGSKIWGKVVDPANPGEPMTLKGTVVAGAGGCCVISGVTAKTGESVEFKGEICKVLGVWTVKKGKFKNSRGCSGNFGMKWVRAHMIVRPHKIR